MSLTARQHKLFSDTLSLTKYMAEQDEYGVTRTPANPQEQAVGLGRRQGAVPEAALAAENDLEAIGAWIMARGSRSPHTRRAYQREAMRFVLYVTQELGLGGLAEIRLEHIMAYLAHLQAPPPHWIFAGSTPASAELPTQILRGPLSSRSLAYSRTVINSLYRYLQEAGYIARNPVALTPVPVQALPSMAERALEPEAWQFVWEWVQQQTELADTLEKKALANRNRWMMALLYHTGLRRSSVLQATMGDFQRREGRWMLQVTVKGGRLHHVVVGQHLLNELKRYRSALGLLPLPSPDETLPLIGNLRQPFIAITDRNLGYLFEHLTTAAADACDDPYLAQQIRQLTAHAVRHTFATHSLIAGSRLESVQDALGHRSINTTSLYAKTTWDMRQQHIERMDEFWSREISKHDK